MSDEGDGIKEGYGDGLYNCLISLLAVCSVLLYVLFC